MFHGSPWPYTRRHWKQVLKNFCWGGWDSLFDWVGLSKLNDSILLFLFLVFLLWPFLLKGCCQTSHKVVFFHLQKWICFRGFSYLKFTFQGGFFLGGEVSLKLRSFAMENPTIFKTRKDGGIFSILDAVSLLESIWIISVKKLCPKISNLGFH